MRAPWPRPCGESPRPCGKSPRPPRCALAANPNCGCTVAAGVTGAPLAPSPRHSFVTNSTSLSASVTGSRGKQKVRSAAGAGGRSPTLPRPRDRCTRNDDSCDAVVTQPRIQVLVRFHEPGGPGSRRQPRQAAHQAIPLLPDALRQAFESARPETVGARGPGLDRLRKRGSIAVRIDPGPVPQLAPDQSLTGQPLVHAEWLGRLPRS